jgi:5-methylcytosine-specific restriction enzyme A
VKRQPNWGKGRGGRPWRRLVEQVKARDKYTCQMCKRLVDEGHCDHIKPTALDGKTEMKNLQWLCIPCHLAKSAKEAKQAQGYTEKVAIGPDGWPIA